MAACVNHPRSRIVSICTVCGDGLCEECIHTSPGGAILCEKCARTAQNSARTVSQVLSEREPEKKQAPVRRPIIIFMFMLLAAGIGINIWLTAHYASAQTRLLPEDNPAGLVVAHREVSLALEHYAIKHGSYPDQLSELIPIYVQNPIADYLEKLSYHSTGESFTLDADVSDKGPVLRANSHLEVSK